MSDKYDVALHAAKTWIAKSGMAVDPRFTMQQLNAYADELALALTLGEGTSRAIVNGMELVGTPFGFHVITHGREKRHDH